MVVEGFLSICPGVKPYFLLDNVQLTELVSYSFRADFDSEGQRDLGRVQIVLSKIFE